MAKIEKRSYTSWDLRELMAHTGGWAKGWDDLIGFLRGPGQYDDDFDKEDIPEMINDIEKLKAEHAPFTTNYRKLYQEITGKKGKDLAAPLRPPRAATDPKELKEKFLCGLVFPAGKNDAINEARKNGAPRPVLEILDKIQDKRYDNIDLLVEEIGEQTWD